MKNMLFFIALLVIGSTTAQNYDYGTNIPLEDYNFVLGTNSYGGSGIISLIKTSSTGGI